MIARGFAFDEVCSGCDRRGTDLGSFPWSRYRNHGSSDPCWPYLHCQCSTGPWRTGVSWLWSLWQGLGVNWTIARPPSFSTASFDRLGSGWPADRDACLLGLRNGSWQAGWLVAARRNGRLELVTNKLAAVGSAFGWVARAGSFRSNRGRTVAFAGLAASLPIPAIVQCWCLCCASPEE